MREHLKGVIKAMVKKDKEKEAACRKVLYRNGMDDITINILIKDISLFNEAKRELIQEDNIN